MFYGLIYQVSPGSDVSAGDQVTPGQLTFLQGLGSPHYFSIVALPSRHEASSESVELIPLSNASARKWHISLVLTASCQNIWPCLTWGGLRSTAFCVPVRKGEISIGEHEEMSATPPFLRHTSYILGISVTF